MEIKKIKRQRESLQIYKTRKSPWGILYKDMKKWGLDFSQVIKVVKEFGEFKDSGKCSWEDGKDGWRKIKKKVGKIKEKKLEEIENNL
jgi:hypothetical protein